MIDIYYLGGSCFRIKDKKTGVLIDPYEEKNGHKFPKDITADILLCRHDARDNYNLMGVSGNPIIIDGPGEYEIKNIPVSGMQTYAGNTVYRFTIENVVVAHLGRLEKKITESQIEELDGVDILIIPIKEETGIDTKTAVEILTEIEPNIVIPVSSEAAAIEDFIKTSGLTPQRLNGKLSLTHEKLPEQTMLYIFE